MGPVEIYIASLTGAEKVAIKRVYEVAKKTVPEATQGIKYGMATLVYKGKGLISVVAYKNHLSIFPFSGSILSILGEDLKGFECTKGTLHFSPDSQIPEDVLIKMVKLSKQNIDSKAK